MMGADLAYLGTRFIGTAECLSPDDYKATLVDSHLGDIVETDTVSGVNANFIAASLAAAGYSVDGAAPEADIAGELAEAHDDRSNRPAAWRDIWSAGHGVGGITDIPTVAQLVDRLEAEYHAALAAQQDRVGMLRTAAERQRGCAAAVSAPMTGHGLALVKGFVIRSTTFRS